MPSRFSLAEASWQRGFASSSSPSSSAAESDDTERITTSSDDDDDILAGHPCATKALPPARRRRVREADRPCSPVHPMETTWQAPGTAGEGHSSPKQCVVPPHREELTPRPQHPLAALKLEDDAPVFAAGDAMGSVCALNAIHRSRSRKNRATDVETPAGHCAITTGGALDQPGPPASQSTERPAVRARRIVDDADSPRGGFGTTPTMLRSQNRLAQRRFGGRTAELEDPFDDSDDGAVSVCSSVLLASPRSLPRARPGATNTLSTSSAAIAASPDYFSAGASPRARRDGAGQWAGDRNALLPGGGGGGGAEPVSVSPTTTRGSTGPQASESGLPARWEVPPMTTTMATTMATREAFWELPDNRSEVTSVAPTSLAASQSFHPAASKADRLKALLQHRSRTPPATSHRPTPAASSTPAAVSSSSVSLGAMKALAAARSARSQGASKATSRSTTPTATARFAQPTSSSRAKTETQDLSLPRPHETPIHPSRPQPHQVPSEGASFCHAADGLVLTPAPSSKQSELEDATRDPAVLRRFSVFCVATDRFGTGSLPRYVVNDTFAKAAGEAIDARSRARSPLTAASTNHSATGKPRLTAAQRSLVFKLLQPALDDFVDTHGNVDYAGLVAHLHRGSSAGASDDAPTAPTQRRPPLTPGRLVAHAAEGPAGGAGADPGQRRAVPMKTTTPDPSRRRRSLAELFLGNKRGVAPPPRGAPNGRGADDDEFL